MGHVSRFDGLLHLEANRIMVSQSDLKTDGGTMTGGARGIMTDVTSSVS
jgi:hypothetical protein